MWRLILLCVFSATCAVGAGTSATDPATQPDALDGSFAGNQLSIEFKSSEDGHYTGTIQHNSRRFPFNCARDGDQLRGTFQSDRHTFDFTATFSGDHLTLESGGAKYAMHRVFASPVPPATQPAAPTGLLLRRTAVVDAMTGCNAATLLVPDGWKSSVEPVWRQNPFDPAGIAGSVSAPDGASQWRIYSRTSFIDAMGARREGEPYMGAEVRQQFSSPAGYVRQYLIPRLRTDIDHPQTVFESELTEFAHDQLGKFQSLPGVKVTASRLRLSYRIGGKAVEEDFVCTLGSVPLGEKMIAWGAECESYRAEQGRLDRELPILRTVALSLQIELPWFNSVMEVGQIMQKDVQGSLKNAASLAHCIESVDDQISDSARKSYHDRAAINGRCNKDLDRELRGMSAFVGSTPENVIELPSHYDVAYVNQAGDVVLAEKAGDLTKEIGSNWRELKRQPD